jgi:putative tricarboxylic transport membrane protein
MAVAAGIVVFSLGILLRTTVVLDTDLAERATDEEVACYWPTVGWVAVALIGYAVALDGFEIASVEVPGLGYIVATAIFLPITARILGSRSPVRDIVIGLVLGVGVYFGFTEFLGVRLPPGILEPIL